MWWLIPVGGIAAALLRREVRIYKSNFSRKLPKVHKKTDPAESQVEIEYGGKRLP